MKEKKIEIEEKYQKYGESKDGNFFVIDQIGVPHPYCIGASHVHVAADKFMGMLGEAAIMQAEKEGIRCATRGCNLSYKEHEKALLIKCMIPMSKDNKVVPELHEYLLKHKELATAEGYAGFAFLKGYKDDEIQIN